MAYRSLKSAKVHLNKRPVEFCSGIASYKLEFSNNSLIKLTVVLNNGTAAVIPGTGQRNGTGDFVITNRIGISSNSLEPVNIYHCEKIIANMCYPETHSANFLAEHRKGRGEMFYPDQKNPGVKESACSCSISIAEIESEQAVYIPMFDIVVTTLRPDELSMNGVFHPAQRTNDRPGVFEELYGAEGGTILSYKLVDSNDRVGNRWMLVGGVPHELKAIRNLRLLDGLYLITNAIGGPNGGSGQRVEIYWTLEQLLGEEDNSEQNEKHGYFIPKTYGSKRDAINLGDEKRAQDLELSRNKLRFEELKAEQAEADHRRKLVDEERARARAEEEHRRKMEIFAAKEAEDRRKADFEKEKAMREELQAQWRIEVEREKAARELVDAEKAEKHETRMSLLKLGGLVLGTVSAIFGSIAAIYKGYVELKKLLGKSNDKPAGG